MDDVLDDLAGLIGRTAILECRATQGAQGPAVLAELLALVEDTELVMAAIETADRDDDGDDDLWAA